MKNRFASGCAFILMLAALPLWAAPPDKPSVSPVRVTFPAGHTDGVYATAFSPDGALVATAGGDKEIILWERATGNELARLPCVPVQRLAISANGKWLAAGGESSLTVFDLMARKKLWSANTSGGLRDMAFSPDGSRLAAAADLSPAKRGGLSVWNAATGERTVELTVNEKDLTTVAWMPNGTQIVVGCSGGDVVLCDGGGVGAVLRTLFNTGTASVADLDVHPDGKRLLVGTAGRNANQKESHPVRVWDMEKGTPIQEFPGPWEDWYTNAQCVRWAEDGKAVVAASFSQPVRVWEADGTLRRIYPFPRHFTAEFDISRDGVSALFPQGPSAALVRLSDGSEQRFAGRNLPVSSVTFSENGKWGLIGTSSGEIRLFEAATGRSVRRYTDLAEGQSIPTVSLSADGSRACAATWVPRTKSVLIVVWETATGKTLVRWQTPNDWEFNTAVLSGDGKTVIGGGLVGNTEPYQVRGWSADTGKELFGPITPSRFHSPGVFAFRPDNQAAALAVEHEILLLDAQTGQALKTLKLPEGASVFRGYLDWSADSRYVVYVKKPQEYYLFDTQTGTLLGWYEGEDESPAGKKPRGVAGGGVRGFAPGAKAAAGFLIPGVSVTSARAGWWRRSAFAGKGRFLRNLTAFNGGIELYDLALDKKAVTLLPIAGADTNPGGEWLAYDDKGRFTGSEAAMQTVSVVTGPAGGENSLPIARFFERYYTPNLVTMALGGVSGTETTPLPVVPSPTDALRTGAPPLVRLTAASSATTPTIEVTVEATEQAGGGVKAIRLYQNGRLVGGPSVLRGIVIEAVSGATTTKKFVIPLASGINQLRAVAYSKTDLESKSADATVTFNPAAISKPALHVFSVGINAYKDATMNLTYARPDAESIADLFDSAKGGKAGGGLFAQTHVARLLDGDATGAAILAGIGTLAQTAQPEDVVLVYLAGHGEMADDVWNFLPTEMRQMALPERVKEFGIPWSRIEAAVGKIRARKVILVLDACKSGGALTGGVRGVAEEQQALAVMARAQGIHILTASTSQQYAGEVKALGHGILTYALLEGLGGKGLAGSSASVMVRELMAYVENRVPELSLQYRGEAQYPVPFDRGQNFPVAEKP